MIPTCNPAVSETFGSYQELVARAQQLRDQGYRLEPCLDNPYLGFDARHPEKDTVLLDFEPGWEAMMMNESFDHKLYEGHELVDGFASTLWFTSPL